MTDKRTPAAMTGREFVEQFPGLALALAELGRAAVAAGVPRAEANTRGRTRERMSRVEPAGRPSAYP